MGVEIRDGERGDRTERERSGRRGDCIMTSNEPLHMHLCM